MQLMSVRVKSQSAELVTHSHTALTHQLRLRRIKLWLCFELPFALFFPLFVFLTVCFCCLISLLIKQLGWKRLMTYKFLLTSLNAREEWIEMISRYFKKIRMSSLNAYEMLKYHVAICTLLKLAQCFYKPSCLVCALTHRTGQYGWSQCHSINMNIFMIFMYIQLEPVY